MGILPHFFSHFPPISLPFSSTTSHQTHIPCAMTAISPFPPHFSPFSPFSPFSRLQKSWFGDLVSSVVGGANACGYPMAVGG